MSDGFTMGAEHLAEEIGGEIAEDSVTSYLRSKAFQLLADDIDQTTRDRLKTAVADAYGAGGGYSDIIDAIKGVRQAPNGIIWLDVELVVPFRKDGFPWGHFPVLKSSSPDRATCSINAAHIVAVVEVDTWELPPLEPDQD